MKLIFLLEELSAKETLNVLLPKILPKEVEFLCISHEGKSDLQRSIPIKLRNWQEPNVKFVIVHDKDSNDCIKLKAELKNIAKNCKREDALVRIICSELESWFLGDLAAVEKSFGINLSEKKNKAIYRNPDNIQNAKQELRKLIPQYQQISGSRKIASEMSLSDNKSRSFLVFIEGIMKVVKSSLA
ncbi:MAG: DUF4276 family protein [Fibromonadaceae bacterium]|jgi:hypothetical protein|nr:DUF4276 family protein [Fibromonadaceae bacterium]